MHLQAYKFVIFLIKREQDIPIILDGEEVC